MLKIYNVVNMTDHIMDMFCRLKCALYLINRSSSETEVIAFGEIIWFDQRDQVWKQVCGLGRKRKARILSGFVQQFYKATPRIELPGSLRPSWLHGVWNKIEQIPCSFILTWKRFLNDHLGCSFPLLIAVFFHLNSYSASPKKSAEYWPIVRRQSHIEIIAALLRLALLVGPAIIRT